MNNLAILKVLSIDYMSREDYDEKCFFNHYADYNNLIQI